MRARRVARPLFRALAALALSACLGMGIAQAEQAQRGNLIVSLDGGIAPLKLPRDHPAPIAVRLEGGLRTEDGAPLARVKKIELGLPAQGVVTTRGLPRCGLRLLRDTKPDRARAVCGGALIGSGSLRADVLVPNQRRFSIRAHLLAFNGRLHGRRAVFVHAFTSDPPTAVVLPFVLRAANGRFGTALVAGVSSALGPWPRLAHFQLNLSRRYEFGGRRYSYLSASCEVPPLFSAGYFYAKARFTLADGSRIGTEIARTCRAR